MLKALKELYEPDKKQLREDIDGITLEPPYLVGAHQLVLLDTKDRVLHFRQPTQQEAFCHIYVPPELSYQYAEGLLDCPGLQGRLTLEMLRDFRAVIWLFLRLGRFEEFFHIPAPS